MGYLARDLEENVGGAHVLVIPLAPQGHISPMLMLATQLARKGIRITFACAQDAISRLAAPGGGGSSSELENLAFRFVPLRIMEGEDLNRPAAFEFGVYEEAFEPVREQLLRDKSAGIAGRPTSIVSDMFLAWTQDLADELQIPRYFFVTSGVIFVKAMQGFLDYYNRGDFQLSEADGKVVPFDWSVRIPGIPPLRYHEIPKKFDDVFKCRPIFESVGTAAGLLVNSFFELEENVIETWKRVGTGCQHIKVPKIYPIGPLLSMSIPNVKAPPRGLDDSASKCLNWLGSQPSSSVLYIAFGSRIHLSPAVIQEMAYGLESSQQRFLWVIPQPKESKGGEPSASISEIFPPGFEARLTDRCCIVTGWAPQLQILAHSATGGFLTHSGWNSTLESIMFGVPMISWPQGAEQHLNCRFLVDLKVAVQLQTGPEKVLERNEVERVVRLLMVEAEGKAIRSRVEEFQRKAATAVADGGSRSRFFLEFVDDVRQLETSSNSGRK